MVWVCVSVCYIIKSHQNDYHAQFRVVNFVYFADTCQKLIPTKHNEIRGHMGPGWCNPWI